MHKVALDNCNKGCKHWADNVKTLLCNHGFANIFNEYGDYRLKGFPVIFKQSVIDCFKQDWHSSLDNNYVLLYFEQFKPDFGYASNLDIVNFPTSLPVLPVYLIRSAHYM